MQEAKADFRFQVTVNGDLVCTSGIENNGVLCVGLNWVRGRNGEHKWLTIHGLNTVIKRHLNWPQRELKPGDRVVVRVLGPGVIDLPTKVTRPRLPRKRKLTTKVAKKRVRR